MSTSATRTYSNVNRVKSGQLSAIEESDGDKFRTSEKKGPNGQNNYNPFMGVSNGQMNSERTGSLPLNLRVAPSSTPSKKGLEIATSSKNGEAKIDDETSEW